MVMQAGFKLRCKIFAASQMRICIVTVRSYGTDIQYEQYKNI